MSAVTGDVSLATGLGGYMKKISEGEKLSSEDLAHINSLISDAPGSYSGRSAVQYWEDVQGKDANAQLTALREIAMTKYD
jgi:hypothetical protein